MTDNWHFLRGKEADGPVTFAKLQSMAREGWLNRDDLVWQPGLSDWVSAGHVPGLFAPSVSQLIQRAVTRRNATAQSAQGIAPIRTSPPPLPEKPTKKTAKRQQANQVTVKWHDLSPGHVVAACGGFIAALGIAFTAIAQSRVALAFTLGGLFIAAVGLAGEIGQLLGQAIENIGKASKEAADRRLRAKELAIEKKRLEVEAARLAQQDKHLERILPAAPVSAGAQAPLAAAPLVHGDSPAGGNVVVINQPPVRLWSPGLAAVLSFFVPGLGQLYKGQFINGVFWFVFVSLGYVALILPGLILHFFCVLGALSGNPWSEGKTTVVRQ
jgi:TM2 domain-containing membrane protein YozV